MITIRLCGGMGNQLFQWALGFSLECLGRNVQFDVSAFESDPGRGYALNQLPMMHLRLIRGSPGVQYAEKNLCFDAQVLEFTDRYLVGYWQSERYFTSLAEIIRRAFFKGLPLSAFTASVAERISSVGPQSCSLHIRRTDNLRDDHVPYHGLTDFAAPYYQKAIAKMREAVPGVHFFVFSDDQEYLNRCKFPDDMSVIVGNSPSFTFWNMRILKAAEGSEAADLYLMSLCRNAIIANSTFSWWGAWLSEARPGGLILAPDPWYNTPEFGPTEIIPERWTKVSMR